MCFGLSAVVEHAADLGGHLRDDGGVEERIETREDHTADDHADDDLDTGVDVALTGLGLEGGLRGDRHAVCLVANGFEEFHIVFTFLAFLFVVLRSGTGVAEHVGDLGGKRRDDGGVEESVETREDHTADDHTDDDLDAGVDVALTGLGLEGGLRGDRHAVCFVADGFEEFLHVVFTFLTFHF